jgi:hypothetical protein
MKIYFNRAGIIPAIAGSFLLLNLLAHYIRHEEIVFFGNTEFLPAIVTGGSLGMIAMLFRRESRKIPAFLIKPRKTKWKMEIGQAYDRIKEAMNVAAVQSSAKGITNWQPVTEDREQGLLQYKRIVQEYSDELTKPGILTGEMMLIIHLTTAGSGSGSESGSESKSESEVTHEFQVLSEITTRTVAVIVGETNGRLDQARSSR